jgi:hypothetical protein
MTTDPDQRAYHVECRPDPTRVRHGICTPHEYVSPFVWDGANAMLFRPITRFLAVDPAREAPNVNSLDEVPDSSWFVNRLARHPMTLDEVAAGACEGSLDPDGPDGSWLIDHGKDNGANPGFQIRVDGERYLLKADEAGHPERATGAAAIAARFYHAAGYWTGCDQVVYVRRALLSLKEGLHSTDNSNVTRPFGTKNLDTILTNAARRGDRYRLVASKWLPGKPLGPFRYEGLRADDPNDILPHEDRRDLRGQRVLAAWLGHFDSREQNSMTTWLNGNAKDPDASPGHIRHWIIDFNDTFGSEWSSDAISRRLNHSYYFDGGDVAYDTLTLGIPQRPWDTVRRPPDGDIFGYFTAETFDPEAWKAGYQNPAFLRMTERDAAWMARIIARFTPEHIERIVRAGDFTRPEHSAYLTRTLIERQRKILQRWLSVVSPIADFRVQDQSLCGSDLARKSRAFAADAFHYRATIRTGPNLERRSPATPVPLEDGRVCVSLPRVAGAGGPRDDDPGRYLVVELANGAAREPILVHLYDLGPGRGHQLVGVER